MASMAGQHRVGAAVYQGNRLISVGWNVLKTHPDSGTWGNYQHAEFACLAGQYKYDLVGSLIYVVRLTRGGNLGISKPCPECRKWIKACGIKRVIYIGSDGQPVEERA
jgi:deoxycytidylate deaminase